MDNRHRPTQTAGSRVQTPIGCHAMHDRLDRLHRAAPVILGGASLLSVVALLAWDLTPRSFPDRAHEVLGAMPLALIAIAYLVYQSARRPRLGELAKAVLLAVAFLFWAANQLLPDSPQATLFNDIAIALFVLDVFLVLVGWPAKSPDESFADTYVSPTTAEEAAVGPEDPAQPA